MRHRKPIPRKRARPRVIHPERSRPVDGHIRERLTGKAREKRRAEIFARAIGRCEEWLGVRYHGELAVYFDRCPNRATEWSHAKHSARKCDCTNPACNWASCGECHRKRHNPKACPKKERVGQRDFKKVSAS